MKNTTPEKIKEAGFSLIEVTIAMVVLLIGLLGVSVTYTAAVRYNAGNNLRLQSLAILQQEAERLRSVKFSPTDVDPLLVGGIRPAKTVTTADGNSFQVQVVVDDDPFSTNVQINSSKTLKEITIEVSINNPTQQWITATPAKMTLRRVRGN